ncbi:MAG: DUF1553 domain-containing protein [Armatimonadota bacterium]
MVHPLLSIAFRRRAALAATATALAAAGVFAQGSPAGRKASSIAGTATYNADIRPVLAEHCFPCHGPDSASRKAGLRLDRFRDATMVRGGRAAIVPGDPLASEVVRRISLPAGDSRRMPPSPGHEPLPEGLRHRLIRWIADGARYEAHWSLIRPRPVAPPAVRNARWVRNPIDRFVLASLERRGLSPAPEADRRTLVRRVALDLTGLPPTADEVERFVADRSPNAYEAMVDRFLASPHWGEHRGRYWLDAARYGDTHGIHIDNFREIWAYRDWVIDAFNRNLPFDQFTIEQLAGDLLPAPSMEQRIATGFTRCNITTSEGGAIDKEYKVLYARDRTETFATVWLGSTYGCAVCHDHKFDPTSQRDFYALSAFFNNTTQAAMDGNIKDTPPTIFVPVRADRSRFYALESELAAARKAIADRRSGAKDDFATWLSGAAPVAADSNLPSAKFVFALDQGAADGAVAPKAYVRTGDSPVADAVAGDFEADSPFSVALWVKPVAGSAGAVVARMDEGADFRGWDVWMENGRIGSHIIHKWPGNALKVITRDPLPVGRWSHVFLAYDGKRGRDSIKVTVDGIAKPVDVAAEGLTGSIRTSTPFKVGQRSAGAHVTAGTAIQDVRLYDRALASSEIAGIGRSARTRYLLAKGDAALTPPERDELFEGWLVASDPKYKAAQTALESLQGEESAIRGRGTIAHVANERKEAPEAHVLFRGDYDKRRDKVDAAIPAYLPQMPASLPRNRMGLARWVLSPENPLATRVTVNRFWQEIFGQGIVRTTSDFGITGELPSHPELLDWLALEFRRDWDIKRVFKLILTSATYRQAAVTTPEKRRLDPDNTWLSRGPRFRMDAELIRDYALAASGLLVRTLGGPSVKPYQPDGVWEAVAMIGSNTRDYKRDSGENLYRRSMYTFWKRSAPPASMEIFNAPSREVCTVRRERTNTPLQALVTLNDVQFVEAARVLATKALRERVDDHARVDWLARRLIARPLDAKEHVVAGMSLGELQSWYDKHPKEASELVRFGETPVDGGIRPARLAAWTMFVNQMLNLDEVLNK